MNPKIQVLYNQLAADGYDVGDINSFSQKITQPDKAKILYDAISSDYDLGDFNEFYEKVKPKENPLEGVSPYPVYPKEDKWIDPFGVTGTTPMDDSTKAAMLDKNKRQQGRVDKIKTEGEFNLDVIEAMREEQMSPSSDFDPVGVMKGEPQGVVKTAMNLQDEYLNNIQNIAEYRYNKGENQEEYFDYMSPHKQEEEWRKDKERWKDRPFIQELATIDDYEEGETWYGKTGRAIQNVWQRFDAGSAGVFGSLSYLMHDWVEKPLYGWMYKDTNSRMLWGNIADYFNNIQAYQSSASRRNILLPDGTIEQKDFTHYFKEGNYAGAIGDLILGSVESMPGSLMVIGSTMVGQPAVGLMIFSASATGGRLRELNEFHPEMSEFERNFNALGYGAVEGFSELLGDVPIGKMLGKVWFKNGQKAFKYAYKGSVDAMIKNTTKKMSTNVGKVLLMSGVGEGMEEKVGGMGQYLLDSAMGLVEFNSHDFLNEGNTEAAYGFVSGFLMSSGGMAMKPRNIKAANRTAKQINNLSTEYQSKKAKLEKALEGSGFKFEGEKILGLSLENQIQILDGVLTDVDLTDFQKHAIIDYMQVGNDLNAAIVNIGMERLDVLSAKLNATREVESRINETDNLIYNIKLESEEENGYTWNLKSNEDTSDGRSILKRIDEDGREVIKTVENNDITVMSRENPSYALLQRFLDIDMREHVKGKFGVGYKVSLEAEGLTFDAVVTSFTDTGVGVKVESSNGKVHEFEVPYREAIDNMEAAPAEDQPQGSNSQEAKEEAAYKAKLQALRAQAEEFAQKNTNPDMGGIVYARVAGRDVRITKGNIVFNEDGTPNREKSSKEVSYENENKEIIPASIAIVEEKLEFTPTAEAADIAEQKLTAPIIAEYENSKIRPYNTGEKVTIDVVGSRVMGEIVETTETGYKFQDVTGAVIDIEPRQIINEDNLIGVDNGVEVDYYLDGELQRGIVEDFYQYRQQGQAIVDGNLINLSDIIGIVENAKEATKETSGLNAEELAEKINQIDAALQSGHLTTEQETELLNQRSVFEIELKELSEIDKMSDILPENEGWSLSEDDEMLEETPEQIAKRQKEEFYNSLPKVTNKKGEPTDKIDFKALQPEQLIRYAELQGEDISDPDLAMQIAIEEAESISNQTAKHQKELEKLNSLKGSDKLAAIDDIKSINSQIADLEAKKKAYEDYVKEKQRIKPIGKGAFGNIYNQFKGKAKEAIEFLLHEKEGEALGALYHPEVGDIDLVWGNEGTQSSDGYGLAKIAKYHPEVLDNLQEILSEMKVTQKTENRINLESEKYQAAVRLEWDNEKKNWLLTAFEKRNAASDSRTDIVTEPEGKQNDTATLQNSISSENKDKQETLNKQENEQKNETRRNETEPTTSEKGLDAGTAQEEGTPIREGVQAEKKTEIDAKEKKGYPEQENYHNITDAEFESLTSDEIEAIEEQNDAAINSVYNSIKNLPIEEKYNAFVEKLNKIGVPKEVIDEMEFNEESGFYMEVQKALIDKIGNKAYNEWLSDYQRKHREKELSDISNQLNVSHVLKQPRGSIDFGDAVYDFNYFGFTVSKDGGKYNLYVRTKYKDGKGYNPYYTADHKSVTAKQAASIMKAEAERMINIGSVIPSLSALNEKLNETTKSLSKETPKQENKIQSWIDYWEELKNADNVSERPDDITDLEMFYNKVKVALNGYAQGQGVESEFQTLKKEIEDYAKARNEAIKKDNPKTQNEVSEQKDLFDEPVQDAKKSIKPEKGVERIEDVGEKIGGARKDLHEQLSNINNEDIGRLPLSKVFPKPDYAKMAREGNISTDLALYLSYLYDNLPPKPRKAYRVHSWANMIQKVIDATKDVLSTNTNRSLPKQMKTGELGAYMNAMKAVGFPETNLNIGKHRITEGKIEDYYIYNGKNTKEMSEAERNKPIFTLTSEPYIIGSYDTFEEAANALKLRLLPKEESGRKYTKTEIYQDRKTKDVFIGKKTATGVIRIKEGFETAKEAREYLKSNQEEIQAIWDAMREIQDERRQTNRNRIGADWREGKDVTADEYMQAFGFRGVEFGNWVNQAERQESINNAYDALMDLSHVLGINPKAISLNGELGFAFGARGKGNASAHYEPGKVVINLTKTKGAGSLAHEWWHALDNYFSRMRKSPLDYVSNQPYQRHTKEGKETHVRNEVLDAFKSIVNAVTKNTELHKRAAELDKTRSSVYWSTKVEMTARAFEHYVIQKLQESGSTNDYLANYKETEEWIKESNKENPLESYPYPTAEESAIIGEAFQQLFDAVEQKEDSYALFQKGGLLYTSISEKQFNEIVTQLQKTRLARNVILDKAKMREYLEKHLGKEGAIRAMARFDRQGGVIGDGSWHVEPFVFDFSKEYPQVTSDISRSNTTESTYVTYTNSENGKSITVRFSHHENNAVKFGDQLDGFTANENEVLFHLGLKEREFIAETYLSVPAVQVKRKEVSNYEQADITIQELYALGKDADVSQYKGKVLKGGNWLVTGNTIKEIERTRQNALGQSVKIGRYEYKGIRFLSISNGEVYGFVTPEGDVYIDTDNLNANTPIHEFGHLWWSIAPKETKTQLISLFKQTAKWKELENNPAYSNLNTDEKKADELFASWIGNRGEQRINDLLNEANGDVTLFARIQNAINKFWEWLKSIFGNKTAKINQMADMTLEELFAGKDILGKKTDNQANNKTQTITLSDGIKRAVREVNAEVVNGFYSPIENAVHNLKQSKGTGEQMLAILKKEKGVKADELAWTGVEEWLKTQKSVTKEQILDYIKNNRVQILEVVKGGGKEMDWTEYTPEDYDGEHNMWVMDDGAYSIVETDEGFILYDNGVEIETLPTLEEAKRWAEGGEQQGTKYEDYQLKGEKSNYKEVLITMPFGKDGWEEFKNVAEGKVYKSPHWNEPNILVHLRVNTRETKIPNENYLDPKTYKPKFDDAYELVDVGDSYKVKEIGKSDPFFNSYSKKLLEEHNMTVDDLKEYLMANTELGKNHPDFKENKKDKKVTVLFLEELQSDWAQQGRNKGFNQKTTPNINIIKEGESYIVQRDGQAIWEGKDKERAEEFAKRERNRLSSIPSAPFVTNTESWTKLGLKIALQKAVESGVDKIAWTTGEQQNERYDLSKQVDEIIYRKDGEDNYYINIKGGDKILFAKHNQTASDLENTVGKEIANKIVNEEGNKATSGNTSLSGVDLQIGGQGMKVFYGSPTENSKGIIGSVAEKLIKEITGENVRIETTTINGEKQHSISITPEIRETIERGLPLFQQKYLPEKVTVNGVKRPTRNSNGGLIHNTTEGIENFWKWFGDSKMVDDKGNPLVLYHGTPNASFNVFGEESYFTENIEYAKRYQSENASQVYKGTPTEKGVYETYLSIKKPFDTRNEAERKIFYDEFYRKMGNGSELSERGLPDWTDASDLLEFAKEKGYDGIVIDEGGEGGYGEEVKLRGASYVPISPNQIKSATDNTGKFDSKSDDIRFQIHSPAAEAEKNRTLHRDMLDAKLNKAQIKLGSLAISPSLLREAYQDKYLPARRLFEHLRETGLNIKSFNDWYEQATHLPGRIDAQFEDFEKRILEPMWGEINSLVKQGHSYRDIENYTILKHGLERNEWFLEQKEKEYKEKYPKATQAQIDNYLSSQPTDYSGVTAVEEEVGMSAEDFINQFENKSETDKLWKSINKATRYSLDKALEGQLISRDKHSELTSRFEYYIPLRGFDKEIAEDRYDYTPDMGTHYSMLLPKAEGRVSRSEKPFAHIWQMAQSTINASNKNLHNLAIKRVAELDNKRENSTGFMTISKTWYEKTGEDTWELRSPEYSEDKDVYQKNIKEFEERMNELHEQGLATQKRGKLNIGMFIKPKQAAQHEVHVMQNGEEFVIYFNTNPRVPKAINGLNAIHNEPNIVQKITKDASRGMAANFTTRNPIFVASNFLRDNNYATSTLLVKEGVKYTMQFEKNIVKAMGALQRALAGKADMTNKMDVYVYEYLMNGGRTGYSSIMELDRVQKRIDRKVKGYGRENVFNAALEALKTANDFAENITRLAAYVTSREAGRDIVISISNAKEVSVNFNRGGSGALGAGFFKDYYLFFNANIQALQNHLKVWKAHPGKMAAMIASYALSGLIQPILMSLMGGDDKEKEYMKLSDWERQTNFIIPTGSGFIKIPISHEFRVYHTMGDLAYQYMMGYMSASDAAENMLASISDLIPANPLGATQASWAELTPDLAKPIVQLITNTNFMGTRIYDEYKEKENILPGFRRVRVNKKNEAFVPEYLIKIAEGAHYFTGGDGTRGGVSFNPDIFNHIMRGYFGGLYTIASQTADIVSKGIEATETGEFKLKVRETPLKAFYTSSEDLMEYNSRLNAQYYDIKKESDKARKHGKDYIKRASNGDISFDEGHRKLEDTNYYFYENGVNNYLKEVARLEKILKEASPEEQELVQEAIDAAKQKLIDFYQKETKTKN